MGEGKGGGGWRHCSKSVKDGDCNGHGQDPAMRRCLCAASLPLLCFSMPSPHSPVPSLSHTHVCIYEHLQRRIPSNSNEIHPITVRSAICAPPSSPPALSAHDHDHDHHRHPKVFTATSSSRTSSPFLRLPSGKRRRSTKQKRREGSVAPARDAAVIDGFLCVCVSCCPCSATAVLQAQVMRSVAPYGPLFSRLPHPQS